MNLQMPSHVAEEGNVSSSERASLVPRSASPSEGDREDRTGLTGGSRSEDTGGTRLLLASETGGHLSTRGWGKEKGRGGERQRAEGGETEGWLVVEKSALGMGKATGAKKRAEKTSEAVGPVRLCPR